MLDLASGGRNKYQRLAKQGVAKLTILVNIKDGAELQFWDEGPWPVGPDGRANAKWQTQSPTQSRLKLISAILKKDDNDLPIFFAKEKGQKVWDQRINRFHSIPTINDDIKAAMVRYAELRAELASKGMQDYQERKRQFDTDGGGTSVDALVDALARRIGGADAPAKKADKPGKGVGHDG